jgi:hypothetical protein
MRIATYNVEWFTNLFDNDDRMLADDGWSGRQDVKRADQLEALGIVFTALDADAVLVVEAPDTNRKRSTVRALEGFAKAYGLRTNRVLMGFANDTQQEIALLYDPSVLTAVHDPMGDPTGKHGAFDAPRFDGVFRIDLDIDGTSDQVSFSKPPLEAALTTQSGAKLRLIGVHVKSKAPHGASTPAEVMRLAIANRRKQAAQCIWLRQRIDGHLAAGEDLIVLGDFNDGPGLDAYEKLFGRSGVEIVLGEDDGDIPLYDPHARMALSQRVGAMPVTARFYLHQEKRYLQALLDYVMISPGLRQKNPRWRIWHPFDDPICYKTPELREALLTASDHFPVSLDLDL